MLKFSSLYLKNCLYFKNVKLPLDTGEILIVNGKNLCSREKGQTNGAGKSLLLSYVPNIVFASDPIAIRSNSKKDLFTNSKDGVATLKFQAGEDKYKILQKGGMSSIQYDVFKNGELQKIRTTPLSEKYIKSVFPLSEAEFYTTVYLNSQREFVFQKGKSDARLKFFTEFFRLDYYDQMRAEFQQQLKAVKNVEIEVATLEGQRLRLVEDLKELETDKVDSIEQIQEEFDSKQELRKKISLKVDNLSKKIVFAELKEQLLGSISGASRPDAEKTKKLVAKIKKIEEFLAIQSKIENLKSIIARQEEKARTSKKALKGIADSLNLSVAKLQEFDPDSEIESLYKKYESKVSEMRQDFELYNEYKKDLKSLTKPKVKTSIAKLEEKVALNKNQIQTFRQLKDHIENGTCSVCGSTVDLKSLEKIAKLAESEIESAKNDLLYSKLVVKIKELGFDKEKFDTLLEKFKKIEEEYEKHLDLKKNHKKFLGFLEEFKAAKKACAEYKEEVQNLESSFNKKLPVDKLEDYRAEIANSKSIEKLYVQLETVEADCKSEGISLDSFSLNEGKEKLKKLKNKYRTTEGRVEELRNAISRHTLHKEKEKLLNKKLKEVSDKIEEKNVIVSDKVLLENLIKVYSNKGIKIQRVNAICKILERNLNHFKSLLFDENFKFRINITETAFDVIVDRGAGMVSDVRRLSGSEGRRFNLLLLISLLPLTPAHRRSNLVILDEMESNASSTSTRLFCERYIPELHKMVPNIIVVTPLDLRIDSAKRVLVTKDKNGSTVDFVKELDG